MARLTSTRRSRGRQTKLRPAIRTAAGAGSTATFEIAEEVLGAEFAHFAEALARVSADTPLITAVGGRLIARGQIGPELLANDTDFRNTVFAKFAADCEGDLPAGRGTRRSCSNLSPRSSPYSNRTTVLPTVQQYSSQFVPTKSGGDWMI